MKININWGWGIAILFSSFVMLLIGFIVLSLFNRIDLVSQDYYIEELSYQKQIDRITRSKTLGQYLTWDYDKINKMITLNFPVTLDHSKIKGKILFFRPSDAKQDMLISVHPDDKARQYIDVHKLSSGFWRIKIFWQTEASEFYHEGQIIIN